MTAPSSRRVAARYLRAALYEPDAAAPTEGEWDRTGAEPRWRQAHEALIKAALRSWKGDPVEMKLHLEDVRAEAPQPGSGGGKQLRAQAEALFWELEHNRRPTPRPLYRGSHLQPRGPQSWSEKRSVAELWAKKNGGRVFVAPKGTLGLRILDYTSSGFDSEREWLVVDGG